MLTVFNIFTGGWVDAFQACSDERGVMISAEFFVPTLIIGFFIILNLFIAILLEAFSSDDDEEDEEEKERIAAEKKAAKKAAKAARSQATKAAKGKEEKTKEETTAEKAPRVQWLPAEPAQPLRPPLALRMVPAAHEGPVKRRFQLHG